MDTNISNSKNLNITNNLDCPCNSFPPSERVVLHFISMCLLTPCRVTPINVWSIKLRMKLILLSLPLSYAILRRFLPGYGKVRLSDMFLFLFGFKGDRRELLIVILYGIVLHNLLNVLNTQQMTYRVVSTEIKCYQTIEEVLETDLVIIAHADFEPYFEIIIYPTLQKRLVLTKFTKLDLNIKRYAYLISCDVANMLWKTAANFDQQSGHFMMVPMRDPIVTVILSSQGRNFSPEYAPETGILDFHQRKTIHEDYHQLRFPQATAEPEQTCIFKSSLWEVVWIWLTASVVSFILEHFVHRLKSRKRVCKVDTRRMKLVARRTRSKSEPVFNMIQKGYFSGYGSDSGCLKRRYHNHLSHVVRRNSRFTKIINLI